MKTSTLLMTGVGRVELSETELPAIAADEILLSTAYSCISPGTELRCLAGQQAGAPAFPFIPGYALTGVVIEAGPASGWEEGARVFASGTRAAGHTRCWGGHCGHAVVKGTDAIPIPAGLDLRAAATAKLAAIAYHGLTLAQPLPHEK
ncbi:MAG: hypothetical protein LR015_15015 [Verrucomicrobia bacterium]|nr:hypothetical protein [Verrucomicrobiota bacterium]